MKKLAIHPALASFPEQPEPVVSQLALEVKKSGLVNPVVLCDGMILDGRARLVACERAGVDPSFFAYQGDDPVAFVVAANAGRQMSPGQRALAAARAARVWKEARRVSPDTSEVPGDTSGDASERAARAFGLSRMTVFRAERVLSDEAIARDVEAGRLKINVAFRRVAPRKQAVDRDPDGRAAVGAAVDRVERKAFALRDELRELVERPNARGMMGDFLRELATEFFNLAEGKEAEAS